MSDVTFFKSEGHSGQPVSDVTFLDQALPAKACPGPIDNKNL